MAGGPSVRILGIDPGSLLVGYGCLEVVELTARSAPYRPLALLASNVLHAAGSSARVRVVAHGVLRLGGERTPLADRLLELWSQVGALLARCEPDELALEEAFHGKSVAAALRIGEARGVILAAARARGLAVHQFAPARVKRAVAGHGTATKDGVARMVCQQLGIDRPAGPPDVTDALAVALCRAEERRSARPSEDAGSRCGPRSHGGASS